MSNNLTNFTPNTIRAELILLARRGETRTYGEVAALLNVEWRFAFRPIQVHLGTICEMEHRENHPLLSVLVVNQQTGICGHGFFNKARELGRSVTSEQDFFREERQRVFDHWRA